MLHHVNLGKSGKTQKKVPDLSQVENDHKIKIHYL